MREANTFDLSLLILLAIIWGSSFFNIKIATYSYDPITLALVRVIFASVPLLILCKIKKIKVEAFDKNWQWFALIGLCNIAIPFVLIAIGTSKINSYLAAILMSTTPLSGSILAHFFTKDEKLSFLKTLGVLIGFSGVVLLFFDKVIINNSNYRRDTHSRVDKFDISINYLAVDKFYCSNFNNLIILMIKSSGFEVKCNKGG